MKLISILFAAILPVSALAAPLELQPADPQPSGLKQGLAVTYAYPTDVKTLAAARSALDGRPKQGAPLAGLSYNDTNDGDKVLTAQFSKHVAADISGYIKFDAPGIYTLNFMTNDGLEAWIGGQEVAYYDDRTPCGPTGEIEVSVPTAGWYPIQALYFQRLATACLMMEWGTGGGLSQVPNAAFGH